MRHTASTLTGSLSTIILILFLFQTLSAADGVKTVSAAIPRSEAAGAVKDWMKLKGYKTTVDETRDATFIKASGRSGDLLVEILDNSAMASVLRISSLRDDDTAPDELSGYINAYVEGIKKGKAPAAYAIDPKGKAGGTSMPVNPDAIVCIEAVLGGETVNLTGFVADRKGLILCTAHYMNERASIRVSTNNGKVLPGRLIRIDRKKDLALIDCSYDFGSEVDVLKGVQNMKDSRKIIAFGCAEKNSRNMLEGVISGGARKVDGQAYWQAGMKVRPGDSGGPVFTQAGVFAGVIKGGLRGRLDYTYIIPLDTVMLFIRER